MRKLLLATVLLAVFGGVSHAEEFAKNPDRFPSIGLEILKAGETGTGTAQGNISADQGLSIDVFQLVFDFAVPVSNSVTFSGAIGHSQTDSSSDRTNLLLGYDANTNGFFFKLGVRYYFNQ